MPTYGQYKPSPQGGYEPWALQVLELSGGKIAEFTFFLDTARLFPLFGLPPRLESSPLAGEVARTAGGDAPPAQDIG
jgi:RNA polymerase sigma-70 factor (ECF subfamily)